MLWSKKSQKKSLRHIRSMKIDVFWSLVSGQKKKKKKILRTNIEPNQNDSILFFKPILFRLKGGDCFFICVISRIKNYFESIRKNGKIVYYHYEKDSKMNQTMV